MQTSRQFSVKLVETRLVIQEQTARSAPIEAGPADGGGGGRGVGWGGRLEALTCPAGLSLPESGPQGLARSGRCHWGTRGSLEPYLGVGPGGGGARWRGSKHRSLMTRRKVMFYTVWCRCVPGVNFWLVPGQERGNCR